MTTINLLNWMWQSSLDLGACWLLYYALLRREPAFQFNRGWLLLAPLLTAALPLLPLPEPWLVLSRTAGLSAPALLPGAWLPEVQVPTGAAPAAGWSALLLAYGAGVLLSALVHAGRLLRLWWLTRALPRQPAPGYVLRPTGGRLPTSSFGRQVFWNDALALSPAEAAQVLRHELVHVRQGHSADRLWLGFWQCLLWYNPFVHLCARSLAQTHEYLADAGAAPAAPAAYAALLARQALAHFAAPSFAHSFSTSQTLTRIAMLNHLAPARRWKQWLTLPLLGLLLGVAACEKADQLAAPPPPPPAPAEAPVPPAAGRVYTYVEQMPAYVGGMSKLIEDLAGTVKYPEAAHQAGLEGKVFVGFVVDTDGRLQQPEIRQGVQTAPAKQWMADEMNQAALKAVRELPGRWTPGQQDGQPVKVAYTVPITFALK
ncbi:M56 family metallopeptidase [Hymenobacter sp. 15J16-1T3B]|uniref:TonB family protein n=1 Tax=Hymenobacter sp. 15J16-1T3B TaxID=2886941 RepID=UPI001D1187E8|nr:M56 family metallopeptidase [Hymenobacter sp. 15J16-1T3B]MCC3155861.1 M56 family metallopeptidase [Hymenobacter sp. 15J16-1T3B]